MKHAAYAFGVALSLSLTAGALRAQPLGSQGDAIFAAERVFGIRGERRHEEPLNENGGELERDVTTISLGFARSEVPYNLPRIGFDYLVIDKLSVGGVLAYSNSDIDEDGFSGSIVDFAFAPRVGYLHMFGSVVGIWPRGGFMYHSTSLEDNWDEWTLALSAECMFPIVVAPHFGVLLGLAFDQALSGDREYDGPQPPDRDISYRSIGIQVGLFGWI